MKMCRGVKELYIRLLKKGLMVKSQIKYTNGMYKILLHHPDWGDQHDEVIYLGSTEFGDKVFDILISSAIIKRPVEKNWVYDPTAEN